MTDISKIPGTAVLDWVVLEKSSIDSDVETLMQIQEDCLMKSALAGDAGEDQRSDAYLHAVRELEQLMNGLKTIPYLPKGAS